MSENKTYIQTTAWGSNTVEGIVKRHFKKEEASEEVVLYCRPNEFVPVAERKIKDGLFQGYKKRTVVAAKEADAEDAEENEEDAEAVAEEPEDGGYGNKKRGNFERDYYISSKGELHRDELHGSFFEYYESGQMKSDLFYKNGKQDGLQVHFKEDGTIESMKIFKDNKVDGALNGFIKMALHVVKKDWKDWSDMDDHSRNIITMQTGALLLRNRDDMVGRPIGLQGETLTKITKAARSQSRYVS